MKPRLEDVLRDIRAHCLACSGGVRQEVEQCKVPHCRLYPYRSIEAAGMKGNDNQELNGQINMFEASEASEGVHRGRNSKAKSRRVS